MKAVGEEMRMCLIGWLDGIHLMDGWTGTSREVGLF